MQTMTDLNPTADDGSIDEELASCNTPDADAPDTAEADSRRTFLKATGLLAALGLGGVASSGTAAAKTDHNHLGEIWKSGTDFGGYAFAIDAGGGTDSTFVAGSRTTDGTAVNGRAVGGGNSRGVSGESTSGRGAGVFGEGYNGVVGRSDEKWAVKAEGDLGVSEFLSVTRLGTRGGPPVEIDVGGQRALRIEPTVSSNGANVIGGHPSNSVGSATSATIGGGGYDDGANPFPNEVTANFGTIAGGWGNSVSANQGTVSGGLDNTASGVNSATVSGGFRNTASGGFASIGGGRDNDARAQFATIAGGGPSDTSNPDETKNVVYDDYGTIGGGGNNRAGSDDGDATSAPYATVGGGDKNEASGLEATVGGGFDNLASGNEATIGGGARNVAIGKSATIPGGHNNTADGWYSFAAGQNANTNGHDGAFVFADSDSSRFKAQNDDEARFEMPIYAPAFNTTSARAKKAAVESVNAPDVLDRVEELDVNTWEFDHQDDGRHMGPMAEEFAAAFELGDDDEHIATVDADGVALAAIQGLADRLDDENEQLRDELSEKDNRIDELEAEAETAREKNAELEATIADLAARLEALENRVGPPAAD